VEALLLNAPATECSYCGDDISSIYEETNFGPATDPSDGTPMCDDCFHDHFEFACIRCGNYDLSEDKHRYLVILEECGGLTPGIYSIIELPYFTSNYFDMWWNTDRLTRIRDADGSYYNEGDYPSGHLCTGCRVEMGLTTFTKAA
jgi:hypothetical protein